MNRRITIRVLLAASLLAAVAVSPVRGQQDYQFTQFAFNKLALNPAYAGCENLISLQGMYRRQWTGLEGAPQTLTFSGHAPFFHERVGLGLLVYDDRLGVSGQTAVSLAYSYKVPLGASVLSAGLEGSLINVRAELTALQPLQPDDPAFSADLGSFYGNFGAGVYWYWPGRAFAGVSMPRLLHNDLSVVMGETGEESGLVRHTYIMAGYVFRLTDDVRLRPAALVKFAGPAEASSPADADLGLSALLAERVWIGASYRLAGSFNVMAEALITDQLMLGYAYDIPLDDLGPFHGGSHEIALNYRFTFARHAHVNPRSIRYF